MKKIILETSKVLKNSSLLNRLSVTFFYLFLIRVGLVLPLPGIDIISLSKFLNNEKSFINFLYLIAGGNFSTIGLFALNIFPAINASILLEFLIPIFPFLDKLRKEEGELGEKKLSTIKKFLTLIISIIQGIGIVSFLKPFLFDNSYYYYFALLFSLVTGAMAVLWISELITEKGIVNGSSLIIFINILGNSQKLSFLKSIFNRNSFFEIIFLLFLFFLLITLIIFLQESTREIPIISAQQLTGEALPYFSKRGTNIPLKLNQSGILPLIFASTIFLLPSYFGNKEFLKILTIYIIPLFYYLLIIFFSYLYSTFAWDPKKISEDLKKVSASIPGVRPGIQTEKYLENILFRVSLIGGIFLALIISLPNLIQFIFQTNTQIINITSLIILVGVCLEIQKNIKTLVISTLIKDKKGVNNESTSVR